MILKILKLFGIQKTDDKMKRLKRFIRKQWKIDTDFLNKDLTLGYVAEQIVCMSENCSIEEAYKMYIGNKTLHLPGIVAMLIVDEMKLDSRKSNVHMTLRELLED